MPRDRITEPRDCLNCGVQFFPLRASARKGLGLYCSSKCSYAYRTANWKERFWSKVDRPNDPNACWNWTAGLSRGYGTFRISSRTHIAPRLAYELTHGPIPPGAYVCHRCDNPKCVNPAHLYAGDAKTNMRDLLASGKTLGDNSPARRHRERVPRGSAHHKAVLTEQAVMAIKQRLAAGERVTDLANEFNVRSPTISDIKSGRNWAHVTI